MFCYAMCCIGLTNSRYGLSDQLDEMEEMKDKPHHTGIRTGQDRTGQDRTGQDRTGPLKNACHVKARQ